MPRGEPKTKFYKPEMRQEFWKDLCKHISEGYSMASYPNADEDTVYRYMQNYPDDCPIEQLAEAQRKSLLFWEKIGTAGATGKLPGFNAASWIFNMKNRAKWSDRIVQEHTGDAFSAFLNSISGKSDGLPE